MLYLTAKFVKKKQIFKCKSIFLLQPEKNRLPEDERRRMLSLSSFIWASSVKSKLLSAKSMHKEKMYFMISTYHCFWGDFFLRSYFALRQNRVKNKVWLLIQHIRLYFVTKRSLKWFFSTSCNFAIVYTENISSTTASALL